MYVLINRSEVVGIYGSFLEAASSRRFGESIAIIVTGRKSVEQSVRKVSSSDAQPENSHSMEPVSVS